jgi:hypothetical protein
MPIPLPKLYWDHGRPGGDMTAITVICPQCHALHSVCYEPSRIMLIPFGLDCDRCGTFSRLTEKP